MKKLTILIVLIIVITFGIYYIQVKKDVIVDKSVPLHTPRPDDVNIISQSKLPVQNLTKFLLMVDINGDGLSDKLMSDSSKNNGAAGLIWNVYINKGNGTYEEFNEVVVAHPSAVAYGSIQSESGEKTKTLITYHRSNAVSGNLVSYKIENNKLVTSTRYINFEENGQEIYDQYFKKPNLKVEIIP